MGKLKFSFAHVPEIIHISGRKLSSGKSASVKLCTDTKLASAKRESHILTVIVRAAAVSFSHVIFASQWLKSIYAPIGGCENVISLLSVR
jgi:hypothetical protein